MICNAPFPIAVYVARKAYTSAKKLLEAAKSAKGWVELGEDERAMLLVHAETGHILDEAWQSATNAELKSATEKAAAEAKAAEERRRAAAKAAEERRKTAAAAKAAAEKVAAAKAAADAEWANTLVIGGLVVLVAMLMAMY